MTTPKLNVLPKFTSFAKSSAYVVGVKANGSTPVLAESTIDLSPIQQLDLGALGVKHSPEVTFRLPAPNGAIYLLVGIGDGNLDPNKLREISGAASRELSDAKELVFGLPVKDKSETEAVFEGALLGRYQFGSYRGLNKLTENANVKITVVSPHKPTPQALNRIELIAAGVAATQDLVNAPANDIYPQSLAAAIQKAARGTGATVEIWDEKRLAADGFGGILGVGKGSSRPPRLVRVEYKPKNAKAHLAFVGKGITFDSGGLSIKPAASMVGMKYDMTGAATVGQAALVIARLGLPVRVTAWLCIAENLVSGTSTRPSDVLKIRNGKTVEVINTDAEGRLVLADGLSIASEAKPDMIVDVATLTGAASIALGNRYTGLMGHGRGIEALQAAAATAGELVWHMPLPADLRVSLKSEIADIANAKFGANGGMLLGGLFLQEFIGKKAKGDEQIDWAHLDIAPSANNDLAPWGYNGKGATGVMLRTLVALAESYR
jgi:leucyl aminopeptidase